MTQRVTSRDEALQPVRLPGVDWLATGAGRQLLDAQGDLIARTLAGQGSLPVKTNPLRQVYYLAREGVYLKRFDESSAAGRIKRLFRGPAARIEFARIRRAEAANVPVPSPLACGVMPGASLLVTASCQPARNLNGWLDEHGWDEQASAVLVELLLSAHAAGLLHDDLHAGNILYRREVADSRMWLLDLQRSRFRAKPSTREMVANLAPLAAGLAAWASPEQLERLLADYHARAQAREWVLPAPEQFIAAVRAEAKRHDARQLRARVRSILRTNKYFARVELPGGWSGHVFLRRRRQRTAPGSIAAGMILEVRDWLVALADVAGDALPGVVSKKSEGPLTLGGNPAELVEAETSRAIKVGKQSLSVVVTRHAGPSGLARLVSVVGGSPARRAFRDGHRALLLGQPGLLPLACLEHRFCGVLLESVLICESAGGGDTKQP